MRLKKRVVLVTMVGMLGVTSLMANEVRTPIAMSGKVVAEGFSEQGVTYVPLRIVSEMLGAIVDWYTETKTIKISKGNTVIIQKIGQDTVKVNDKTIKLESAALIKKDLTYVPLRFVSEILGATVDWDAETKTVFINISEDSETPIKDNTLPPEDSVPPTEGNIPFPNKEESLKDKYIKLSKKTRNITEFKAVPVTNYTTQDKVPQNVFGYRFDKIRFIEIKDFPIKVAGNEIYNIELDTLENGAKVFVITIKVINRNLNLPIVYGTKEKGLLTIRDTNIISETKEVVKLKDGEWIVKQKYHLPNKNRDGILSNQIEYFVFYDVLDMDSIAIKNPFN